LNFEKEGADDVMSGATVWRLSSRDWVAVPGMFYAIKRGSRHHTLNLRAIKLLGDLSGQWLTEAGEARRESLRERKESL